MSEELELRAVKARAPLDYDCSISSHQPPAHAASNDPNERSACALESSESAYTQTYLARIFVICCVCDCLSIASVLFVTPAACDGGSECVMTFFKLEQTGAKNWHNGATLATASCYSDKYKGTLLSL